MTIVVVWILASFLCAFVAGQKGRSAAGWWFLSMLFSPLLVLLALCAVPSIERAAVDSDRPRTPSKFAKVPPAYLTSL